MKKILFILAIFVFLVTLTGEVGASLPSCSGMVSYWNFDEGSGTTAYDSVGCNDGTIYGATWANGALEFDGVDDYVEVPDDASLDITNEITVGVWVKNTGTGNQVVVDKRQITRNPPGWWRISIGSDGSPSFQVSKDDVWRALTWESSIRDDTWHHVVGVMNGDLQIYVDGVLRRYGSNNVVVTMTPNNAPLVIGKNIGDEAIFNGTIDEIVIFNRALSADEIQQLYLDNLIDNCLEMGPITSEIMADPNLVAVGTEVSLVATLDDTGRGDSYIESAEYSFNGVGCIEMYPEDGFLDSLKEVVYDDFYAPLSAGVYDLCIRGADVLGNVSDSECTFLVVYDPTAGFVTGGGWIYSDPGAYIADPDLEGKANFGFVSKYKKGADIPTGNTEFQFHTADLNFHSLNYDWLVVTGSDYARFKGIGTINGEGEYKFMLWAGDGEPDTFRIRIWEEDEISGDETTIYDNGFDQEISGGSIVIHTGKK
jgi:hypothetical protein